MISAGHEKWFARYERESGDEWEQEVAGTAYEPVIAWDGEGYALVLDAQGGKLVRACGVQGFAGVCDATEAAVATMSPEELRERHEKARR